MRLHSNIKTEHEIKGLCPKTGCSVVVGRFVYKRLVFIEKSSMSDVFKENTFIMILTQEDV